MEPFEVFILLAESYGVTQGLSCSRWTETSFFIYLVVHEKIPID